MEFTETKTNRTRAYFKWLRAVSVNPATRQLIDASLENLQILSRQEHLFLNHVNQFLNNHSEHKYLRRYYELVPGVGTVVSATLITEAFRVATVIHDLAVRGETRYYCDETYGG